MKKVLLVNGIRQLTEEKRLLTGRGLRVFYASSCEEALGIYRREGVNLIITGLDPAGTIEDNLCSIVRRDETLRDVSILAVCRNRVQDIERCLISGANAYVTRPIDPDLFLGKVVFLLNIEKRRGVQVLTKVSIRSSRECRDFFCTTLNVSATGMLIETDQVIAKGDRMVCSFFIPGSQNIVADCAVVRMVKCSPTIYQYGLRFLELSPAHKSAIRAFVGKKWVARTGYGGHFAQTEAKRAVLR
jgi:CheY-like chemotaxis protein